jgi:hypothetical protein
MAFKITNGPLAESMARLEAQSPALLQNEVSLTRAILETACNAGNWGLALNALNILQKLSSAHVSNGIRMHHLLEMSSIQKIAARMGAVLTKHLQDLPNFEVLADAIIRDLAAVITDAREGRFGDMIDAESAVVTVPLIENSAPLRVLARSTE